ncbi:cation transporter [Natronomonas sp.]|uniref:cation transporter n=1 Tax=Natronomonas sp. TaxID=2184060 RepID=UPI002FC2BF65
MRPFDGVTERDVQEATETAVSTSTVHEDDDRCVFELTGLDCPTCAGLIEVVIGCLDGVSNVTTSYRHGTARVDYDAETTTEATLRTELADLGYPVETTDEAFENRRRLQWAEARFAAGVMAGLMVFAPYAAVIYPTRFDLPFYDQTVVALLERALGSIFASHFYLNLAVLSGFVLLFAGGPVLSDARAALEARSPNRSLAVAAVAVGLYVYSSFAAFPLAVEGGVYYDVVVALVLGTTIARQAGVETTAETADDVLTEDPDVTSTERSR